MRYDDWWTWNKESQLDEYTHIRPYIRSMYTALNKHVGKGVLTTFCGKYMQYSESTEYWGDIRWVWDFQYDTSPWLANCKKCIRMYPMILLASTRI